MATEELSGRRVGHGRRLLEVVAFVGIWIGIGELLDTNPDSSSFLWKAQIYLLIGIPLVAAFQLWVRRRPIPELWVRNGQPVARRVAFRILAAALAIYPLYSVIKVIVDQPNGVLAQFLFFVAAASGAIAAAYAFTHFSRETWRYLCLCLATAGVIGALPYLIGDVDTISHPTAHQAKTDLLFGIESLLLYLTTVMVMEEVAFRGAFDSHAHHQGDRFGILTAIFVSALWGAWHAPLVGWDHIVGLVVYQGAVGTFLSIWWRKSGNLEVSGTTHAVIDAIRNASGQFP